MRLPSDDARKGRWYELVALALTVAGLAVALLLIGGSDGFYHDDDVSHYLSAENAWGDAHSRWYRWGRPAFTIPAMFVVHWFGLSGCRIFSALQTAAVAYLAYRIARRIGVPGPFAAAAPALVWLQPLTMTLSLTTLTETPAALYMTLGVWLYLRGNRVWACAMFSLMFAARDETLALAPVPAGAVVLAALRDGDWKPSRALRTWWLWAAAAAMIWAPAVWVAAAAFHHVGDSPLNVLTREFSTEYGRGAWNHMLIRWLFAAGGGVLALAAAGVARIRRRAWLPIAMAAGLVAVHTLIYWRGMFESGGYGRFLVPAAGLVGALASGGLAAACRAGPALGFEMICLVLAGGVAVIPDDVQTTLDGRTRNLLAAALVAFVCLAAMTGSARLRRLAGWASAAVALGVIALQTGLWVRPLTIQASDMHVAVDACVRSLHESDLAGGRVMSTHVLTARLHENTHIVAGVEDAADRWERAAPGELFLWDSKYGGGWLYDRLLAGGRQLWYRRVRHRAAAVFVRLAAEPTAGPASAHTHPPGGAPLRPP